MSGNHVSFVAHHSLLSRGNRISHHSRSQDSLLSDFSVKDAFSSVDVMQKDDISLRQKTEWGLAPCIHNKRSRLLISRKGIDHSRSLS